MSNSLLFFIFVFLFSCATSFSLNTTHRCSVQQTQALIIFKQSLSTINDTLYSNICEDRVGYGYNPVVMNWKKNTDCCDWNGITCDYSTGDVIALDLSCGMLQGTIHPNTTLFYLPRLQRLNLAFNRFMGSYLPPDIGRLSSSLTHLNISVCGFTGQVPANILHLHKLVSLDLSYNFGIGIKELSLEPQVFINLLQNLTVIKELSLEYVTINSVLPDNLNLSSSLRWLYLGDTGLQGKLPRTIFNLRYLEKLDLSSNSFTGYVPSEISHLTKLVSLDLSLMPSLLIEPHILSMLLQNSTTLRDLRLGGVNVGAVLPTYLNISAPLRLLDLSGTNLQGKLPDNILNIKYLEELYLSSNENLSGPLPKVNTSTSIPLYKLDMSHTGLSGEIPSSIGHLTSLEYLDLSYCRLNGYIPSSIGHLTSLVYLDLSYCRLNGSIPKSISNLKKIITLHLSYNMLSGKLPSSLFTLPYLESIRLSTNQLSGRIDVLDDGHVLQTFQKLTNLTYLDLSNNFFIGDWELDTLLSSLRNLKTLILSYNGLSVTTSKANHYLNPVCETLRLASCSLKVFPLSLKTMKSLEHLDLSNNDIYGHIPNWVGEIGKNLGVFDLSNNSITGAIPNVYEGWWQLQGFILNGNKLEGKVPTSLHKFQGLTVIDLGNNHLNDTFPSWLGDLPYLQDLVLRSNKFHGEIVTSSMVKLPFKNLRVIDLSRNGFVGKLPTNFFRNFYAMKNVVKSGTNSYVLIYDVYYSIEVAVKGMDRDFPRLLDYYTIVDLSDNKFEREIPNIIGSLKYLKVLNLSHNRLTGKIPQALEKLSEIESLDLSWNQLTGEIPQSLTDLSSLEILNLSQNHLVGRIPQGKQFNTFEGNSFGGNLKLCGFPLPKNCSEQHLLEQLEGDEDVDDEERGIIWEVVIIGYGCGTLLGFTTGYLMLSTEKSNRFNSIADAIEHMIFKSQNKRRSIKLLNQTRQNRLRR